ncbi:peptidase U32 family protein [Brevibacillus migulae]|uniref:peptidase U32 family protein n=1 Tax=Brevibacillus migulae TaxID=1644114 RepID=UPI00106E6548|nr:peptidase U32 family protein [Brevibacillus migulae]
MNKRKPELLANARDVEEVDKLFEAGADAVLVGDETYALRMPGNFDLRMVQEAVKLAHGRGKPLYVSMNALFHHEKAGGLEGYIRMLDQAGVDAIVFGDPAVFMAAREAAPGMKLQWNTETTSTNYQTVNFWAKKGVSRAVLARELSLAEVIAVKQNSKIETQIQVHGMTCIFHSKRELVSNYLRFQGSARQEDGHESQLFLKETTRDAHQYPIYENRHGTHIMSAEDICMLEHLPGIVTARIDSLFVEGMFKSTKNHLRTVAIYRQALDLLQEQQDKVVHEAWIQELQQMQPEGRLLGTGFYFKEQIY